MSTLNGNGSPPPDPPGDSYEHRLSRWLSDAKRTGTIPRYIAERVEPPPAWLRKMLGPPAIRLTPGKGRIYPRAEWIWRWVILALVLTIGLWSCVELRAIRGAVDEAGERQSITEGRLDATNAVLVRVLEEIRDE